MAKKIAKGGIVDWPINKLKQHPKQAEFFPDPPKHQIDEIAKSMKAHGLNHPIEILPDGTIISGHRRTAAARSLDWPSIPAIVRYDLADNPVAAENHLIADNLFRRQMSPLQIARCYRRLKQLALPHYETQLGQAEKADLRDVIGTQLQLSGRHLDRLLRIVEHCPIEVQQAFELGQLSIASANHVAGMSKADKQLIVDAIRDGGKPSDAIQAVNAPARNRYTAPSQAVSLLVQHLARAVEIISPQLKEIRTVHPANLPFLEKGKNLIGILIQKSKAKAK